MSKAVKPDGNPAYARDERGILLDLDIHDVELMAKREPGSAARYLQERETQIAEVKEKERGEDDRQRFEKAFVEAGGRAKDASEAYRRFKNEQAVIV